MSSRTIDRYIYGAIAFFALFTAVWIRPHWIQLLLLMAMLCGAGVFGQMLFRWAFAEMSWQAAATGATFGLLMAVYAGVALVHEGDLVRLGLLAGMLVAIALHIRAKREFPA